MAITEYEDRIKNIVERQTHGNFIYDFLEVYNKIARSTITKLRKGSNNLAKNQGEVYLKNKLYFKEASDEVLQVYSDVEDKVAKLKSKPRYIIVTNYQQVLAKDTKTGDTLDIKFDELPKYFDFFLAWNGIEKADFEKENPADLKAAERFAKLFDALVKENKNIDRHGLNLFLIRLLFCLFAEDTGIFERDLFTNYLKRFTAEDGSDMNDRIMELFGFLDKRIRKDHEPAYLKSFPFVNGQLFTEAHLKLKFNKQIRDLIIEAGELIGWAKVNPDILGSMLQAVATEDKRSHLGMHYTSVPNIMKVIKPLFLDDLRESFVKAKGNEKKLNKLYERIGNIRFMDPACGSGNFLIIAYKELRQLEIDIIKELNNIGIATMYVPSVTLNQFYGIEIDDFACDVTRLSLWIAEHQMNVRLHEEIQDAVRPTLPLQKAGAIICGNALRLDWEKVLPREKEDEVYLFGNPPYLGAKKQSPQQKSDLLYAIDGNKKYKKLDYISGWFVKGAHFVEKSNSALGFVTTNSISQGEQVAMLWPQIFKYAQISFAYQSFKWSNNAQGNAGVTVVIIGLVDKGKYVPNKSIFNGNLQQNTTNISPYLVNGRSQVVKSSRKNINKGLPKAALGSLALDGGNLILNKHEYKECIIEYPELKSIIKKFVGSNEYINSIDRYVLWMSKTSFEKNKMNPIVRKRVKQVKEFRMNSGKSARDVANKPYAFFTKQLFEKAKEEHHRNNNTNMMSIIAPRVSSENRLYVPMGFVDEEVIISDAATAIYDAPLWLLGLLESRMHMTWLRAIGGRLKTDYRYSAGLVYNTFPVPDLSTRRKNEIKGLTLNILDIREEEGGTLAELYGSPLAEKNPKPMNPRLLAAHQELDEVVDRAYKASGFKDDSERLALLLNLYSKKVRD
ncbi:DNA methyltransferase [Ligilactobacillus saerimneri]|uniref:DNA methyltransferase n=1 Tax=Ligilactobacillus saerimneri TaxID=228229 RepID=UPI0024BBD8DC|nr:DNA methyltransferase [Ligilactobacillus saerimneri]